MLEPLETLPLWRRWPQLQVVGIDWVGWGWMLRYIDAGVGRVAGGVSGTSMLGATSA